jgi:hypothetical protein
VGDRAEQGPVVVADGRSRVVASQDRELVAHHDDLEIFRSSRPDRETDQSDDEAIQQAAHSFTVGCRSRRSTTTTGVSGTDRLQRSAAHWLPSTQQRHLMGVDQVG